jgi:plasmid stability protein
MANLTIRNVPDDVHKGLRLRAAENGRSVEEEIRRILAAHVGPAREYKNPKTPEEIDAAVKRAQAFFAPMAKTYSVDQYLEEKRAEARRERAEIEGLNDPPQDFRK